MTIIGYARVSSSDQKLDRQLDRLRAIPCDRIFQEKKSGGDLDRPQLNKAIDSLRPGDTFAVASFDRLARSLKDLIWIASEVDRKQAHLRSIKEQIDSSTPAGKLQFHLFGALAEFEKDLIRQRTHEGLSAARARGRNGGRPSLPLNVVEQAWELFKAGHPVKSLARSFDIGESTLYRKFKAFAQ